ncbi:MAG: class I SAM-dependent methyltransferase, partial [Methanobrevibacter sp.]|nr:class I SAM-dependent methyltransferase [Methanobrevibacter sp.]
DVSKLPFDNEFFNIVTAFETIYFWPDFIENLKEVHRVLKKDGIFFVCNESSQKGPGSKESLNDMGVNKGLKELLGMQIYSPEALSSALEQENFKNISTFTKEGTDWLCAICLKK